MILRRLAMCSLLLVACACAVGAPSTVVRDQVPTGTAELTVSFSGLTSDRGRLVYAVYADAASFDAGDAPLRSGFLTIVESGAELTVELPFGEYAIKAYHDANDNRTLDRGAFGVPEEAYGFSNDARARFGPPDYGKARFELTTPRLRIEIALR